MGASRSLSVRRPVTVFVALALAAVGATIVAAPNASAAVNCAYAGGTGTLTITLTAGDTVTIARNASNEILVNGATTDQAPCSLAAVHTTADTDTINVVGSGSAASTPGSSRASTTGG